MSEIIFRMINFFQCVTFLLGYFVNISSLLDQLLDHGGFHHYLVFLMKTLSKAAFFIEVAEEIKTSTIMGFFHADML